MINNIHQNDGYIAVTVNPGTKPYFNTGTPSAGMLRYNGSNGNIEVYDGLTWLAVGNGSANVGVSPRAYTILKWAEQKMEEELLLNKLAQEHPALADAVDKVKQANDELKVIMALTEKENGMV